MRNVFITLAAAAALALAAACGSDDNNSPPPPPSVAGVGLSQNTLHIMNGQAMGLTALVWPSNAANKNVTWSSSDASVATAVGSGLNATVTACALGTATITVRTADGGLADECRVIVEDGAVHATGVALDRTAMGLVLGGAGALEARVRPFNAANQGVTWTTSNAGVATVTPSQGSSVVIVRAMANGTSTITVKADDGGWVATCVVTVTPHEVQVYSLGLTPSIKLPMNRFRPLTATVLPVNATEGVSWTSSNADVATVTGSGLVVRVTGVSMGTATIRVASSNGRTAECVVTVLEELPPVDTAGFSTFSVGLYHSLAIKEDGSLWAWGSNLYGQLGLGDDDNGERNIPTQVGTDYDWVSVSATWNSSLALKEDGSLWGWGENFYGRLFGDVVSDGDDWNFLPGHEDFVWVPTQVGGDYDWVTMSAGQYHVLAIKTDGSLWTWGESDEGALGLGDGWLTVPVPPTRVGVDNDWTAVASRREQSLALKADGSIWAWGDNEHGQLGLGDTEARHVPTKVSDGPWASLAIGGQSRQAAIKSDGGLWVWGENEYLGIDVDDDQLVPARVGTASDWAAVATAYHHTVSLKTDGSLWAWGGNWYGQLGVGDYDDRVLPTQIGTDTDWVFMATWWYHTLAIKRDGSVWAWGRNLFSQLGDGTDYERYSPVLVGTGFRIPTR